MMLAEGALAAFYLWILIRLTFDMRLKVTILLALFQGCTRNPAS